MTLALRPFGAFLPFLLLLLPRPVAASDPGELRIEELGVDRGWVAARLHLADAFDADTRASLASGLPITVRFTTELWQHRSRWFDRQVSSRVLSYRIRWDPGEQVYTLTYPGPPRRDSYDELDPLLEEVSRQVVRVHPLGELEARHRYFVIAEAAIRPLTLEEFRELDGWIGGRIRGQGDPETPEEGEEGSGGVARTVVGLLIDLSGFGDVVHRARTDKFRPGELRELPPGD